MDIFAQRRVRNVLSGNYGSVFKGRSLDFDDLREYNYGDDVKDIDWKATALAHRDGATLYCGTQAQYSARRRQRQYNGNTRAKWREQA